LQQPVSGNDNGIHFDNCSDPVIAAGNSFTDNTIYGLHFIDCSGLGTLDSLTFTGNGGYGAFWIQNSGDFLLGSSIINSVNNWPLSIDIGSFPDASSLIPVTGNTNNDIQVTGGSGYKTGTWPYFPDLIYIFTGNPTIQNGGSLTVAADNTLKFDSNKYLYISGTFNALGTSGNGIDFDFNGTGGNWGGIQYQYSNSSGNLSYCTFRHSSNGVIATTGVPMVTIDHCNFYDNGYGSKLSSSGALYANCLFQNNTIGIYANVSSPIIHNCELFENTMYGLSLNSNSIPDLGTTPFEGNSIYSNGSYDIYNGSEDISALYTYWGPIGFFNIPDRIYDINDDINRGLVEYEPWGNQGHTLALTQGTSPQDVSIQEVAGDMVLSWTASPDATFYEIYTCAIPDTSVYNWSVADTEVYGLEWIKPGNELLSNEFFFILGIIGE
jgi:hypothetical protein